MYRFLTCVLVLAVLPFGAAAQTAAAPDGDALAKYESAWRPLLEHEGVRFSFIFYPYADNDHGGVVVRLINDNAHPVRYRFTMVFRDGDENEHEAVAEGRLAPGQMQTGDHDGLFWIPFKDGRSIGQVGMRHYRVRRVAPEPQAPEPHEGGALRPSSPP